MVSFPLLNPSHQLLVIILTVVSLSSCSTRRYRVEKDMPQKNLMSRSETTVTPADFVKPASSLIGDTGQDVGIQIFPLGHGAGLVAVDVELLERSNREAIPNPGLSLTELDPHLEESLIASSISMAAVAGVMGMGVAMRSRIVRGVMIEGGLGGWSKKQLIDHFKYKQAKNLQKFARKPSYGFREIRFDESAIQKYVGVKVPVTSNSEVQGRIVLGILPDQEILDKVKTQLNSDRELSVLSVVEGFELDTKVQIAPKKSFTAFRKAGEVLNDRYKLLEAKDYQPVQDRLIHEGADFIHQQLNQGPRGRNIYVHCKSGKGRSATMVAAYLMKYRGLDVDQAVQLVKAQRPEVSIARKLILAAHYRALRNFGKSLRTTQPL